MEIPTYWPQVLTIVIANVSVLLACFGMFMWVARQARSDYLHMDKKFEDNRREMNAILEKFMVKLEIRLEEKKECQIQR